MRALPARLAAGIVVVCLAAGAAAADSPSPVPQIHVGDTWKYRTSDGFTHEPLNEFTHRVVDVNDREIVIEVRNAKTDKTVLRYFNHDWNLLDNGDTKYDPCYPEFKFPLSAGMAWSDRFTSVTADGSAFSGYVAAKIPLLEKVTVAAGTFDAYRIERDVELRGTGASAQLTNWRIITWYAPAVRRYVRREFVATRDGRVRSKSAEELTEYTAASAFPAS